MLAANAQHSLLNGSFLEERYYLLNAVFPLHQRVHDAGLDQ